VALQSEANLEVEPVELPDPEAEKEEDSEEESEEESWAVEAPKAVATAAVMEVDAEESEVEDWGA